MKITRENVTFAEGFEQKFSTEIFRVVEGIPLLPLQFYVASDLQHHPIACQFYIYEIINSTVLPETEF